MLLLFLFTGLALVIFLLALSALLWSTRSGQWDDVDTPPLRMLLDEQPADTAAAASPTTPPAARP